MNSNSKNKIFNFKKLEIKGALARKMLHTFTCENKTIIVIAILLFLINQLIELLIVFNLNENYHNLCKWDCGWYGSIVVDGYHIEPNAHEKMDAANWAFFPFFPLAAKFLGHVIGISAPWALILTSKIFFLLAIFGFIKMAKAYSPSISSIIAGSVVAFNPYAIYGNVGYTESSFLFFSALFFYALKKEKYMAAGIVGAVLSSVRLAGLFALVSYVISVFLNYQKKNLNLRLLILSCLLIPLGLAIFIAYLYWLTGDGLAFSHIQRAWGRSPSNPLNHIMQGLQGDWLSKYYALISVFAFIATLALAYKREYALAVFSLLGVVIPLSTGLVSIPRYIFWQAPLLFMAAHVLSNKIIFSIVLPFLIVAQVILYRGWLLGGGWVI
jgi:hypothetical protein